MSVLLRSIAAVAALLLPVSAYGQDGGVAETIERARDDQYVIGAQDVLEIALWNNTTVSRTVPVRPDGKISLPLLHDVQAAGLTPKQLRDQLDAALARFIESPSVAVIVREVRSFKVSVVGEVKAPGRFELSAPATVLDLLAMAGGLSEYAKRGRIVVLRRDGAVMRQIPFAYDKLVPADGSRGQDNFFLQRDDIIFVP